MTGCEHPRTVDVTDFDTAEGAKAEMCRDCGAQIVRDAPPTRYSLMSPVEATRLPDGDGVQVRAVNGDTWVMPAVLFDALYRESGP